MNSQQRNLVYVLWQEVPKLVYAFWTCKPVVWSVHVYYVIMYFNFFCARKKESCTAINTYTEHTFTV